MAISPRLRNFPLPLPCAVLSVVNAPDTPLHCATPTDALGGGCIDSRENCSFVDSRENLSHAVFEIILADQCGTETVSVYGAPGVVLLVTY